MAPPKQIQKQLLSVENRINVCNEYKTLWQEYFKFFSDGFEDKKILQTDEEAFFRIMNALAFHHYRFVELSGQFFKEGDGILKLLTETVSLQVLKQMSEAQFSKMQIDWHTIFLSMNKCLGKWIQQLPPPAEVKGKKKG